MTDMRLTHSGEGEPGVTAPGDPGPLHGITVVELAHWMAAPAAGGVLADWGADVIKIEPHGGEPMRRIWGSAGANPDAPNGGFTSANRGKRSLELDVRSPAGREALEKLLDRADVLLSNLRPSALERLGLSPAQVTERFPRLIFCTLTAYGWGGPDQERAGYDLAGFFARAGVAHQITTRGTPPAAMWSGIGDTFTAMTAVAGISAALVDRARTGRGRVVEASLQRTGMWAIAAELATGAMGGHPRPPYPREQCPTPMYNSYQTSDGRWFYLVGVEAARQLPKVLAAIGRADLASDERFAGARALTRNRTEVIEILDAAFAAEPIEHWAKVFDTHDVFYAPIQTPLEVINDQQARATGAWIRVDGAEIEGRPVETVEAPIRWDGRSRVSTPAPPRAGEHNREILSWLGYSDDEIDRLGTPPA
jgi:crotonobetainyl-CoA:carnitine CoA-transferase CaiB-like acyl-CoA transferase